MPSVLTDDVISTDGGEMQESAVGLKHLEESRLTLLHSLVIY